MRIRSLLLVLFLLIAARTPAAEPDGVWVRFQLTEPKETRYHVLLAGYIHKTPWYLPRAVVPEGADKDKSKRIAAGAFTPWFDLKKHAARELHGRMARAGGVAEFPNVTATFVTDDRSERCAIVIELATAPDEKHVVKRFRESFEGNLTSFLVSPQLAKDADSLECASEMTARRLKWAREASGGKVVSPKELLIQTSFWAPQRRELNLQEAEVLRLLGFNTVGNQMPEVREKNWFRSPGATHSVGFGPGVSREQADQMIQKLARGLKDRLSPGAPFNFSDEITAGSIGKSEPALAGFHAWLEQRKIKPADLGVKELREVVPIESPEVLRERQQPNRAAANRIFYYTSRFRQETTTERLRWLTESFHQHVGAGPRTSTLVADHPYFSGTGLGMGMGPNPAWGRAALAADWFDLARRRALDLAGIEDWMGLQYMYGPSWTWEGFQLMGFQAAMFRSGSRGTMPIQAWITPSDETNLRLKSASALCQGAKHFFYWTYGPTCTSTENYWSDLRGSYEGVVAIARQLAAAEHLIAPGRTRPTRLALLYSISSDLWQPFGYVHMLERRGTYLSLVHDQYLVDFLTEEDVEAGRLKEYDVLYVTDPCIKETALAAIGSWVMGGGHLYGSCAAGSRNEFNEEVEGLARVFGIQPPTIAKIQPGAYHIRGVLNGLAYLDQIELKQRNEPASFGVIGVQVRAAPATGTIAGVFKDGSPAVVSQAYGKGQAVWIGACPGISYIKDAKFVARELKEQWPAGQRRWINGVVRERRTPRLVELSHPVVEAGVYDAPGGTALVLANFTYQPIEALQVRLMTPKPVRSVHSCEKGELKFTTEGGMVSFTLPLGLNDIVRVE
jgi:hypothetical protein